MLREAIASASAPMSLGELAWYAHLVMVAGIVLGTVGNRLVVVDPLQHTGLGDVLVIFGGPAIYLLGRGILDYAAFSAISSTRPLGVVALAALIPVALRVPITVTAALAAVVLAGVAIGNLLARRFFPRAPSPPRLGSVPQKP